MNTYEVREANIPDKDWVRVQALTPKGAIENLLRQGQWYTEYGVTELIHVREVARTMPAVFALTDTGLVTETI